jgi:glutamate racemase
MKHAHHQPEPAKTAIPQTAPNYENAPIGIFDSGIGGLTVVKEVMRQLPNENIIYLGDTARVPYGTKSDRTIKAFTLQCCLFLLEHNVKMIIIACNTASAVALDFISNMFRIPVIGVILPGSQAAVQCSEHKHIGVIGTHTTINSQAYTKTIRQIEPQAQIISQPCSLFVPVAEEGWIDHPITQEICVEYLKTFERTSIDSLVLGCTHYPILKTQIQKAINSVTGRQITLIDSGIETGKMAKHIIIEKKLENKGKRKTHKFYVTDLPKNFMKTGELFLGSKIEHLEMINVETLGF